MDKTSVVRYLVAALIAASIISLPANAAGATMALTNPSLQSAKLSATSSFKVSAEAVCSKRDTPLNLLPTFILKLQNPFATYQKEVFGTSTGHNAAGTYSFEAQIELSESELEYLRYATSVSLQVRAFSCDFDDKDLYSKTVRLEPPRLDVVFKDLAVRNGESVTAQFQVTAYNTLGEAYEIASDEVFDVLPTCQGYYEGDLVPLIETANQPAGEFVAIECSGGELTEEHAWREGAINHAAGSDRGAVLILSDDEYAVAQSHLGNIRKFEASVRQTLPFGQSAIFYVTQRDSNQLTSYGVIDPDHTASSAFDSYCDTSQARPAASSRNVSRAIVGDTTDFGADLVRFWLEADGLANCDRLALGLDDPQIRALELLSDSAVVATGAELHVFELPVWQYIPEAPPLEVTYSYSVTLPGLFTIHSLRYSDGRFWATGLTGNKLVLLEFQLDDSGFTLLDEIVLESDAWSSGRLEVAKGVALVEIISSVDFSTRTVIIPLDSRRPEGLSILEGEAICGYVSTCSPTVIRINSSDVVTIAGVQEGYLAKPLLVQAQINYTESGFVTDSKVLTEVTNSLAIAPWSTPISIGENTIWLAGTMGTYIRVELYEVSPATNSDSVANDIDSSNSPSTQSDEPKPKESQGQAGPITRVKIPTIPVAKTFAPGDWIEIKLDGIEIFDSMIEGKFLESSTSQVSYSAKIPSLSPGLYDLELRGSFGKLTIGGAIRIPEATASSSVIVQLPPLPTEMVLAYSLSLNPKWIKKQVSLKTKGLSLASVTCAYRGSRARASQICSLIGSGSTQTARLLKIPGNSEKQIIRIRFKTAP